MEDVNEIFNLFEDETKDLVERCESIILFVAEAPIDLLNEFSNHESRLLTYDPCLIQSVITGELFRGGNPLNKMVQNLYGIEQSNLPDPEKIFKDWITELGFKLDRIL